jgi:choline dehydrogenase
VTGIEAARSIMHRLDDCVERELVPGAQVRTQEALRTYVRDQAWGHHASCTCAIGRASDPRAVVGSDFRVLGTSNLRVVDASIFPRIPGFFLVTAIYMAAEKASSVIARDAAVAPSVVSRHRTAQEHR